MADHRNRTLEMLKLFTAYMVVFLHVPFYGVTGITVNALARFAVPFFFLVSGFFSYRITPDKIKRRLAHLVFLLAFAILICTVSNLSALLLKHGFTGLVLFFKQYLDLQNLLNLLLFNKTIQVEYLWYLFAMLYIYLLRYLAAVFGVKDRVWWAAALVTLCLNLILGEFLSIFGIVIPNYFIRNFALTGIPFFGLGMLAGKYKHKLAGVPNSAVVVSMIIGISETLISRYTFGKNELHLGSVFILFSLAVVFIKYPNIQIPAKLMSLAGCSTYIYILHPIVSGAIVDVLAMLGVHSGVKGYLALRMIHPLFVCVVSTVLAYVLNRILSRVEIKIRQCGAA